MDLRDVTNSDLLEMSKVLTKVGGRKEAFQCLLQRVDMDKCSTKAPVFFNEMKLVFKKLYFDNNMKLESFASIAFNNIRKRRIQDCVPVIQSTSNQTAESSVGGTSAQILDLSVAPLSNHHQNQVEPMDLSIGKITSNIPMESSSNPIACSSVVDTSGSILDLSMPSGNHRPQNGGGINNIDKLVKHMYIELLEKVNTTNSRKFRNISTVHYRFKFINTPKNCTNLSIYLYKAFAQIIEIVKKNCLPFWKIGLTISIAEPQKITPMGVSFRNITDLKVDDVVNLFEMISQSNSQFLLTEDLEVSTTIIQIPNGKAPNYRLMHMSQRSILQHKTRTLVNIELNNETNFCLPISLVVGKCLALNNMTLLQQYKTDERLLRAACKELINSAGITFNNNLGSPISDLVKYHNVMFQFNIIVYKDPQAPNKIMYGSHEEGRKTINIFYFEDLKHFVAISNLTGFFAPDCQQCNTCFRLYKDNHLCPKKCNACNVSPPCLSTSEKIECSGCNRFFKGQICYDNHKDEHFKNVQFCKTCSKLIDYRRRKSTKLHECGERFCRSCSQIVDITHKCYIKIYKGVTPTKYAVIFYDFEATQNIQTSENTFVHEPNLCVAEILCYKCIAIDDDFNCQNCVTRKHIFENDLQKNCVQKFIDFCSEYRSYSPNNIYVIAHNFKSYDGQFILRELVKRKKPVKPIMCGLKVLKVLYDNYVIFIDSLNFLSFPLKKFPSTFGIENMCKGWYPHFFNTTSNYNYKGPLPSKHFYGVDHMNKTDQEKFNLWYDGECEKNVIFDNRIELIKYCTNDVVLLRKGCVRYMLDFLKVTNINPFLESFTLAQAVMKVFRKNFLKIATIGITPKNLYSHSKPKSRIGSKWIIYQCIQTGLDLLWEYNLPHTNFYVDGYSPTTKTVYEFLGCYYHGCRKCFLSSNYKIYDDEFVDERYKYTKTRLNAISKLGYHILEIWECTFTKFLSDNPAVDKILNKKFEFDYSYINPRDAIYGGRTETFKLHYQTSSNERVEYLDFTSLYPYVNKYCPNPIKHPVIVKKEDCNNIDLSAVEGLIRCKILPPQNLCLPVLPIHSGPKLMFSLCRECTESLNITFKCTHTSEERCLIGTWVISEVNLALEKGYKIMGIAQIWIYETLQYDPVSKKGGLFTGYMNHFLKIKQESSGWPSPEMSDQEKNAYIEEFYDHEGIRLDKTKINVNPCYRQVAKDSANSLWGKFSQRDNLDRTDLILNEKDLYELLLSPGLEVVSITNVNDDSVWVVWKYKSVDYITPLGHSSVAIGAFTTANARIKLYKTMEKVSDTLLYCDTDSIIYVQNKNQQPLLTTGSYIGDLTDEIKSYGPNAFITEFVSTGPKCYAYKVFDPTLNKTFEVAKCKGFVLTIENIGSILNFTSFKNIITDATDEGVRQIVNTRKIKRRKLFQVVTEPELKRFQFTFDKRVQLDDLSTVPYGYK